MFDTGLLEMSRQAGRLLQDRGWMVATAESCTGGLLAGLLTEIAGSSAYVDRGFVTYTNEAKQAVLGVRAETLSAVGAVSEGCATEMAVGALQASTAQAALSTTGIAGPGGGVPGKPVGTVCIGWAWSGQDGIRTRVETFLFEGDRQAVRRATLEAALKGLLALPAP